MTLYRIEYKFIRKNPMTGENEVSERWFEVHAETLATAREKADEMFRIDEPTLERFIEVTEKEIT